MAEQGLPGPEFLAAFRTRSGDFRGGRVRFSNRFRDVSSDDFQSAWFLSGFRREIGVYERVIWGVIVVVVGVKVVE